MPGGPLGFMRLIRVGIFQTLRALNAHFSLSDDGAIVVELIAKPDLLNRVLEAQNNDEKIDAIVNQNRVGKETEFTAKEDGFLTI